MSSPMQIIRNVLLGGFLLVSSISATQDLPAPHMVKNEPAHHTANFGFDGARSAVPSSDGRFFAFNNGDVWSVVAGGVVGHLNKNLTVYHLSAKATWMAFTEGVTVKIWTLSTGEVRTIAKTESFPISLVGSPDESLLAVLTRKEDPKIYDVASGRLFKQLASSDKHHGVRSTASRMAFSPDGSLLACMSEIWTVATGMSRLVLDGTFQAFSSKGHSVVTSKGNGSIAEWDITANKQTNTFDVETHGGTVFEFSDDGGRIAVDDPLSGTIALWDVYSGLKTKTVHLPQRPGGYKPSFVNNSDWLLATTLHDPTRLVRLSTAEEIAVLLCNERDWAIVRCSDGAYDGSPAAILKVPGTSRPLLIIDGLPLDPARFGHVPGLLGKLPGAPVAAHTETRTLRR